MRFQETTHPVVTSDSTVVLFASYEERATAIARQLASSGFRGKVFLLYCADTAGTPVALRLEQFSNLGLEYEPVAVSVSDPVAAAVFGRSLRGRANVFVDVTCFTRGNLFAMLWGWELGIRERPDVSVGYCPAGSYGSWLTRRFNRPENLLGFGGPPVLGGQRHLICLVGFDGDRAWSLVEHLEPSKVMLCVGANPSKEEFVIRNQYAVESVLGHGGRNEIIECPISDPSKTADVLDALVARFPTESTVHIGPFSSKLSCMAVYSTWLRHRDVRLWNVVPSSYNYKGYSEGHGVPRCFNVVW